jgi:hypothetical protein
MGMSLSHGQQLWATGSDQQDPWLRHAITVSGGRQRPETAVERIGLGRAGECDCAVEVRIRRRVHGTRRVSHRLPRTLEPPADADAPVGSCLNNCRGFTLAPKAGGQFSSYQGRNGVGSNTRPRSGRRFFPQPEGPALHRLGGVLNRPSRDGGPAGAGIRSRDDNRTPA